jgi:hypothetical protein
LKPEIDRENHSRTSTTPLLTHTIIVTKETPSSFRTSLKVSQVLNAKQLLLSHFFLLIYYSQMQIIYMLFYFILFYFTDHLAALPITEGQPLPTYPDYRLPMWKEMSSTTVNAETHEETDGFILF